MSKQRIKALLGLHVNNNNATYRSCRTFRKNKSVIIATTGAILLIYSLIVHGIATNSFGLTYIYSDQLYLPET